jgi:hypothetical protein
MTTEYVFAISRHELPEICIFFSSSRSKGARKTGRGYSLDVAPGRCAHPGYACCINANPSFAGTTVSGHFAQTGPVLGGRLRAGPVPGHLAPPGPLLDDFAGAGSLLVHFARTGPVGAFSWAGPALGHLARPVQGQRAPVVRARPLPVSLPPSPKLGIA